MEDDKVHKERSGDNIDPSSLTTQQLWREIASLEKLMYVELGGIKEGIEVAHQDLVRVPTDVQEAVKGLKELLLQKIDDGNKLKDEKFANVDQRFKLIEESRVEQKRDTATAVDAALKAAKEAVTEQNQSNTIAISKSEAATAKQIDQLVLLINTTTNAIEGKIDDIKKRLTIIEGMAIGVLQNRTTNTGSVNMVSTIIGIVGTVLVIASVIYAFTNK